MSGREFTEDVLAELQQRLLEALAAWRLSSDTAIRLLNVSENATFLLSDATGRELVVRVHREGYSSAAEIRSELAWLEALRRDGVIDTAAPVPGSDGDVVQTLQSRTGAVPRFAVGFERLPGREPEAVDALRWFEPLGEVTARLHRHARGWPLPPGFTRKRWDVDSTLGARPVWGPWRDAPGLDAAGRVILERAGALIRQRLERFGAGAENFGLIHADLRLANLLVDGRNLQIIDFDDCGFGWLAYDFAAAVSFIEHEAVLPELLAAWCTGYRKVGRLSAAVRAEIPTFVMLRRMLLTAWLATHAEVPFAQGEGLEFTAGTVALAEQWLSGRLLNSCANE